MEIIFKKDDTSFRVQQGDILLINDDYYLVCPHPENTDEFYLPSLNGVNYWGTESWNLKGIKALLDDEEGQILSKNDFSIKITERKYI